MLSLVERVAPSDAPVLLLGESGTGKELVAAEIHQLSARREHPFVPVTARDSPSEAAMKGTLFLDEIGDVPLPQQVKLLRPLATGIYRRVGSVEQKHADFRLVCATHRDLQRMVEEGTFRRDLYYRINAFPIALPPLRRLEDLELIANELLARSTRGDRPCSVSPEAFRALETYSYPGNVRELANILQRGCLLADDGVIRPAHLPDTLSRYRPATDSHERTLTFSGSIIPLEALEHRYLQWAEQHFEGDRRTLARLLGVLVLVFGVSAVAQEVPPAVLHTVLSGQQVQGGGGDADGRGWLALVVPGNGSPIAWSAHLANVALPAELELRARPDDPALGGDIVLGTLTMTESPQAGTLATTHDRFLASQPHRIVASFRNAAHPNGAVYGRMATRGTPGIYTFPIAGRVQGQGGTAFVTDMRLTDLEQEWIEEDATATIEWWPAGASATAPASSVVKTVKRGAMLVLDDVVRTEFGISQGLGALRVITSRPLHASAKIYNDQVAAGKGSFGLFAAGATSDLGSIRYGGISHLHNVPIASGGSRTNVGWFNHSSVPVVILMSVHRPDGTAVGQWAGQIGPGIQQHLAIADLIPAAASIGDFHIMYSLAFAAETTATMDMYVYAAVTDNVNGDAIFVLGQPR